MKKIIQIILCSFILSPIIHAHINSELIHTSPQMSVSQLYITYAHNQVMVNSTTLTCLNASQNSNLMAQYFNNINSSPYMNYFNTFKNSINLDAIQLNTSKVYHQVSQFVTHTIPTAMQWFADSTGTRIIIATSIASYGIYKSYKQNQAFNQLIKILKSY